MQSHIVHEHSREDAEAFERHVKRIIIPVSSRAVLEFLTRVAFWVGIISWAAVKFFGAQSIGSFLSVPPGSWIALLGGGYVVLRSVVIRFNSWNVVTDNEVFSTTGILKFSKKTAEVYFLHCTGVEVRQRLLERLFNVGTIVVGSSMAGPPELVMKHVEKPHDYAEIINARISHARRDAGLL